MHEASRKFVEDSLRRIGPRTRVVEIGSRNVNGGVSDLFEDADYTGIDLVPGPGVSLVADGAEWLPLDFVDCVVCCSVLEHTKKAVAIIENAYRMLLVGGFLIITTTADPWPVHSSVDGGRLRGGEHYNNVTKDQLKRWLGLCFQEFIVKQEGGDLFGVAQK